MTGCEAPVKQTQLNFNPIPHLNAGTHTYYRHCIKHWSIVFGPVYHSALWVLQLYTLCAHVLNADFTQFFTWKTLARIYKSN